jgi:PIN domain nuclease of toxin-antitoxin system
MNLLLDTHVFLWYVTGDARLPGSWVDVLRDSSNAVYLSVISVWEASIKYQLGKLPLPAPPETYLPRQRDLHGIASLGLTETAVSRLGSLPPLHRDPFDRMLVCQTLDSGLILATTDDAVRRYPVHTLK